MKVKKILKKLVPGSILRLYRRLSVLRFKNMGTKDVFTEIYNNNLWKSRESISGAGSEIKQTGSIINDLKKLFDDLNIKSVLDIPCGDFNWMNNVDLSGVEYTGADLVDELIVRNISLFGKAPKRKFMVIDIIRDPLPNCDLIILRDCLVHFSYKDAFSAICNIRSSGCKYLLTTTFTGCTRNYDIITGGWRRLNLNAKPFCFPDPIRVINEHCTEEDGDFKDKSLALWEISKL